MSGEDFIDFARKMIVMHRNSPVGMRSVVSRSYYGVFHIARVYLEELGFHTSRDESSHRFLLVHLANAGEDNATDAASLLGDLHERRKRADYDLGDERCATEGFAAEAIARADRAARLFEICRQEPARTDVRDGILSYRSKISHSHGD